VGGGGREEARSTRKEEEQGVLERKGGGGWEGSGRPGGCLEVAAARGHKGYTRELPAEPFLLPLHLQRRRRRRSRNAEATTSGSHSPRARVGTRGPGRSAGASWRTPRKLPSSFRARPLRSPRHQELRPREALGCAGGREGARGKQEVHESHGCRLRTQTQQDKGQERTGSGEVRREPG